MANEKLNSKNLAVSRAQVDTSSKGSNVGLSSSEPALNRVPRHPPREKPSKQLVKRKVTTRPTQEMTGNAQLDEELPSITGANVHSDLEKGFE